MSQEDSKKICGIVMPISAIDECNESHWADVLSIINDAIITAGFEGNLVSNAEDVGIIQKRIIQNLYENPIVVCDVSGKNPNVMFELGMRLAFDKPTIIIKDDKTTYSFDTSPIEHIEYPRDLRFGRIVDFKSKLAEKIKATYDKSTNDTSYTTFLKHFGEFTVAKIDKKEVSGQEFIIEELRGLRSSLQRIERYQPGGFRSEDSFFTSGADFEYSIVGASDVEVEKVLKIAMRSPGVRKAYIYETNDSKVLRAHLSSVNRSEHMRVLVDSIQEASINFHRKSQD